MASTKRVSLSHGRKRTRVSNNSCNLEEFCANVEYLEEFFSDFEFCSPRKRRCAEEEGELEENVSSGNSSLLETLPEEILITVVCGVDHDDLKELLHVSKTICKATVTAKHSHFDYCTPWKMKSCRNSIDLLKNPIDEDCEAPHAPKQARKKNRPGISEKLEDVSVFLFGEEEEDEQRWPRSLHT